MNWIYSRYNYLLSLVVALVILYLTTFYKPENNDLAKIENMDKVVHALMFWGLALTIGFDYTRNHIKNKLHSDKQMTIIILCTILLFGGGIEIIQGTFFSERFADWKDWIADIIGGIIGILLYFKAFKNLTIRLFS